MFSARQSSLRNRFGKVDYGDLACPACSIKCLIRVLLVHRCLGFSEASAKEKAKVEALVKADVSFTISRRAKNGRLR